MSKPQFNNRDNKEYQTEDGPIWFSRSVAIVNVVFFKFDFDGPWHVLAEKRSKNMDKAGKYCVTCGYLDWDEDGGDAIRRETYEETNIHLPDIYEHLRYADNHTRPFFVNTDPSENRQNVTLCYARLYEMYSEKGQNFMKKISKFKNSEVDELVFVECNEESLNAYDWAFLHDERIRMAYVHINSKL